jgi:hypothetical protein
MARYYGEVGYAVQKEVRPSVWEDVITERPYFGETVERSFRFQNPADQISNNLMLNTDFDIIADAFAIDHFSNIRYIVYGGTRWSITSVSIDDPRIHLKVGGIYNGPIPED